MYAEALKNLLDVKRVPYTRALHPMMGQGDNQAFANELPLSMSYHCQ